MIKPLCLSMAVCVVTGVASGGELAVVGVEPAPGGLPAAVNSPITVHFDRPVKLKSVGPESFWAFARWSGPVEGDFSFSNNDQTVTLTPNDLFSAGETVMVVLSHDLQGKDGSFLRSGGYSFVFRTAAQSAPREFEQIDSMSTRTIAVLSTRSYGGIGSDLNGDGWLDLTIVNEDSADLRVFLNRADGTGLYDDFLQPPAQVNNRASPSEPSDFNRDGNVDICVANLNTASVSILLGNGDGTYAPQQEVLVGLQPRGIAVLDADGDGDIDIVNTNATSSNMSILFNNGSGVFSPPTFFEGGADGEWALGAADMDEDGLLDLVIGARDSQTILVNRGNGDGTFTNISSEPNAGSVWMLAVGDVNGDGHVDVATANSSNDSGGILLGDGAGGLGIPAFFKADPFPLATDLADLDGDGDLDWINSSFGGDWFTYTNDGNGNFKFHQEMDAPQAASCSIALDIDNDGDLDLALIDELADVVILMKNSGTIAAGDINRDGVVNVSDLLQVIQGWGPCPPPTKCPADANHDGAVGVSDLLIVIGNWSA